MNSSIWLIDVTLTGTTTLGHSGPESNDNEGVLYIFQTEASPSDGLVLYPGHSLGWGPYPSVEMQSVCPIAPVDREMIE